MKRHRPFVLAIVSSLGIAAVATFCAAETRPAQPLDKIRLPDGFRIDVYASNVPNARSMTLGSAGTLFVGTRRDGNVYAVVDRDGDQKADKVYTIASGLEMPNGVAFQDGSLFVAEVNRIIRFDDIELKLDDPPEPVLVNDSFPADRHHGWKFIAFGPDGKLYVPIGAPCNICDPGDPYATITRIDPDGSNFEIFARGIRNTVGFAWHPKNGEMWFTDNGRDWLGDDGPPDELNRAPKAGLHFGYPFCHGADISDPDFGAKGSCDDVTTPEVQLGPHVAALGLRFYTGTMFPDQYRGRLFIAEHGSWNRSEKIGYRLTMVDPGEDRFEVFADGWLQGDEAWGRPVDVQVMPDGALLVSDDMAGAIYRISYEATE